MRKFFCIFFIIVLIYSCKRVTTEQSNNIKDNTVNKDEENHVFQKKGIVYLNEETGEYYFISNE